VARSEVEAALALAPCHAPALLVLASLALEEGNSREAEDAVARLKVVQPERPEPKLLEGMLAHRQHAGLGWRQAFLSAWSELGRPDFQESPLLPTADAADEDPHLDAWRQASSTPVRITLVLAAASPTEEQARWLLARVPTLEDVALVIAVDGLLRDEPWPAELRREAALVLRRKRSQLVQAHPRSMQLRLLHLLADSDPDSPFGANELAELEVVAALPVWNETSFTQSFQVARRHLRDAGVPNTGGGALAVAAQSVADRGSYLLKKRAEATRSQLLPGARHRLGRVLYMVGSRVAQESTLVERMVGFDLMREGASDLEDDSERGRAAARMEEARIALAAQQKAALERWPLPSLHEEALEASARDEWAHLGAFTGPIPQPGQKAP